MHHLLSAVSLMKKKLLTKLFYNNFMVITCIFEVTRAKNCPIIFGTEYFAKLPMFSLQCSIIMFIKEAVKNALVYKRLKV